MDLKTFTNPVSKNHTIDVGDKERHARIKDTFATYQRYARGKRNYHIENFERDTCSAFKEKAFSTIYGKQGSP